MTTTASIGVLQDQIISPSAVLGFAVWTGNPFLDQLRALDS